MPTAAKLVAALFFGGLSYAVALRVAGGLPPEERIGLFREVMAVIGAGCGWFVMGPRAGMAARAALGWGLTTAAAVAFWGVVFVAVSDMLEAAFRKSYRGLFSAIEGMLEFAGERAMVLLQPDVGGLLIAGGLAGGLIAHAVARVWR